MAMSRRRKSIVFVALVVLFIAGIVWGSDKITLQGERTIYTVKCEGGTWTGTKCSGRLVADKRYGFRASPTRREVIYWVRGSTDPSGKFSDCTVTDRDNWSCPAAAEQRPSITYAMKKGRPTPVGDAKPIPFHDVPKWKWWLIEAGVPGFSEALH